MIFPPVENIEGRPSVMTRETIAKLEQGFSYGFIDSEACLYAGISQQALYDYCKIHPGFTERKETLKRNPKMIAKTTVVRELPNDAKLSLEYLKNTASDEFNTKTTQEVIINKDMLEFYGARMIEGEIEEDTPPALLE